MYESLVPIQNQTTYHNYLNRIDIVVIRVRDRKTRCLKLDANMETGHEGIVNYAPHRGMAPERTLVKVPLADFAKRPSRDHEDRIHRNYHGSTSLMEHWQILEVPFADLELFEDGSVYALATCVCVAALGVHFYVIVLVKRFVADDASFVSGHIFRSC